MNNSFFLLMQSLIKLFSSNNISSIPINFYKSSDNTLISPFKSLFSSSKAEIKGEICLDYIKSLCKGSCDESNNNSLLYKSIPFSFLIFSNF